ncbi:R3H domain-containing protein [Besnoitia besnoiti]|uniref:DNA helicase n=1 Tax=Besnoitia besnoiti TaxID=94643 RepID=A0A2A9MJ17_BESBE|nr:R3H domain-containing protein [Besnoitia besnoiti]PFH35643.1 R3H domain-containing protein [Besnoitia besnoiti]
MSALDRLVDLHQRLLRDEHAAETEELEAALKAFSLNELESQGLVLPRLVIHEVRSGLYSRTLVDFCTRRAAHAFQKRQKKQKVASAAEDQDESSSEAPVGLLLPPQHRFTPGDIVGVFNDAHAFMQISGSAGALAAGVVHKVKAQLISIAFEDEDWLGGSEKNASGPSGAKAKRDDEARGHFHLALISSSVTIDRQLKALDRLKNYPTNGAARALLNLCFGIQQPQPLASGRFEEAAAEEGDLFRGAAADEREEGGREEGAEDAPCLRDASALSPPLAHLSSQDLSHCDGFPWFAPRLTGAQKRAVLLGLRSRDLALIHGPPGTGKSTALLELLLQLAVRGRRVLACAPSNIAVDNLLERVAGAGASGRLSARLSARLQHCVRLGHPARVDEKLSRFCLESQVQRTAGAALSREIRRELDFSLEMLNDRRKLEKFVEQKREELAGGSGRGRADAAVARANSSRAGWAAAATRELRQEIRTLRRELRAFEKKAVEEVLEQSPIVFATCAGADDEALRSFLGDDQGRPGQGSAGRNGFDVVVVDEAAQALEAVCWIPLLCGQRAVLAGDHCQLAPTIKSRSAEKAGLGVTLFERQMCARYGAQISQLLDTQFRMHERIMGWSSEQFYNGELRADPSVASRLLADKYPSLRDEEEEEPQRNSDAYASSVAPPFLWIDTAGVSWLQEDGEEEETSYASRDAAAAPCSMSASKSNRGEAALLVKRLSELVWTFDVNPADICVITPYRKQVQLLRQYLQQAAAESLSDATSSFGKRANATESDLEADRQKREAFCRISVNTVDGFQGREGEIVAISLVRSNPRHHVGFLKEVRRLNVAVTRAKRHLLIVGDSETIAGREAEEGHAEGEWTPGEAAACEAEGQGEGLQKQSPHVGNADFQGAKCAKKSARAILRSLFHYACERGEIRSALEFIDISDIPGAVAREPGKPQARESPSLASAADRVGSRSGAGAAPAPSEHDKGTAGKGLSRAAAKKKKQERKANLKDRVDAGHGAEVASANAAHAEERQHNGGGDEPTAPLRRAAEEASALDEKYRDILLGFKRRALQSVSQSPGSSASYVFPSSLTAYERKLIHTLADELGLSHVSVGENEDRKIEVSLVTRSKGASREERRKDKAVKTREKPTAPSASQAAQEEQAPEPNEAYGGEGEAAEGNEGKTDEKQKREAELLDSHRPRGKGKKKKKNGEQNAGGLRRRKKKTILTHCWTT